MIYPHITMNPRGVPCIDETRHWVIDIVADHVAHGYSAAQIVEQYPDLTLAQVHAALTYYYDHQADLEAALLPENSTNITLSGQNGLLINGSALVIHDGHPLPTSSHPEDVIQCAAAATVEAQEPGNRPPVMVVLHGPASLPLTWSRRCCLSPADTERHATSRRSTREPDRFSTTMT